MDQQYSNFIEIKYEALFDSVKKCKEIERQKYFYDNHYVAHSISIDFDSKKLSPAAYREPSPKSDEYIKRKYLEILHEIEVIIKIKKNLFLVQT